SACRNLLTICSAGRRFPLMTFLHDPLSLAHRAGSVLEVKVKAAQPADAWSDELARVHQEIGRLPRREREVFVLCVLQGASRTEAAERLELKVNSVTGLLARARQRLSNQLKASGAIPVIALTVVAGAPTAVPAALLSKAVRVLAPTACIPGSILSLTTSLS